MNDTKIQNTVNTEKTQVATPLWRWFLYNIALIAFIVSCTVWVINTVTGFAQVDRDLSKEVQTLQDTKLDKYEYRFDKQKQDMQDSLVREDLRKLKQHFGIK